MRTLGTVNRGRCGDCRQKLLDEGFFYGSQGGRLEILVFGCWGKGPAVDGGQECEELEGAEGDGWALLSVTISDDGLRIAFCGKGDGGGEVGGQQLQESVPSYLWAGSGK
jgi:hypothetical protein